jgi:hypothetical protein
MSTDLASSGMQELKEAIDRLLSGVRDPAVADKARQEMDRMREETRQRVGIVEVAVDFVRDARDQE